jgi:hypothetical protein
LESRIDVHHLMLRSTGGHTGILFLQLVQTRVERGDFILQIFRLTCLLSTRTMFFNAIVDSFHKCWIIQIHDKII